MQCRSSVNRSWMIHDDAIWPLSILMLKGQQTLEQHSDMLRLWDELFSRGERFVSLRVHLDDAALEHPAGAARATKEWLRQGAAQKMRQSVRAMVIVTPPTGYESVKHLSVEAVFGIPGSLFPKLAPALQWLAEAENLSRSDCMIAGGIVEKFAAECF